MEKKEPAIITKIIDFFKWWNNPDNEQGEYKSIKEFQLWIYHVSHDFHFKWIVSIEDLKEASNFTGIEIENNTILKMSLSEYNIELEVK